MSRCVIVGNARINNYALIKKYIKEDDFFVYCDGGLKHINKIGREPNLIIGDFDSHEKPDTDTEIIELPCEKDDTDTCYAMKECIERGFDEFLFVGVIGERFDHSLGNISILVKLNELRKKAIILDDYSEMSVVPREGCTIKGDNIAYFSILSLSDSLKGVTITDAKYNLDDAEINSDYQYGISNELIDNNPTKVYCKEGNALLIKIFR